MKKRKKKNQFRFLTKNFPKKMQKKLVMLFMTIILAFVIIIIRITYINVLKGEKYTRIVLNQQVYGSRAIPYKRGDIVDRNGTKLAVSERVYNVILDVFEMRSEEKYIEPTVMALKDIFEIDEEKIRDAIRETPESRYTILKKGVGYDKAKKLEELLSDKKKGENVVGVWLEEDYKRMYPYHSLASDAIGFTYGGNQGQQGIEKYYNDVLNGTDGREYGYFNSSSLSERTVKDAKNGYTVVSTIDLALQSIVEDNIKQFNEEHAGEKRKNEPGSKNTAVMIMNPQNGEILAHASYPNYDLNKPDDLSYKFTKEQLKAMKPEEVSEELNQLWKDFNVSGDYEPGSTMKPFTVAAGLETGALKGNETYVCGGGLQVEDFYIHCHLHEGHGLQTVEQALANSCNVALMEMGAKIGAENLSRYQHIFGFGEKTGIDLPNEVDTSSLVYKADQLKAVELATNSFGQGINVSMVQMMAAYCSLINGGNYYQPHIVKEIRDESGRVVEVKSPTILKKTVSEETSKQVKSYMRSMILNTGAGQMGDVEGYELGGKTGTAEKIPRGNNNYVLSFICYAPQENPEIAMYVVIDEPNVELQDDSAYVMKLTHDILEQALPYLNITKSESKE